MYGILGFNFIIVFIIIIIFIYPNFNILNLFLTKIFIFIHRRISWRLWNKNFIWRFILFIKILSQINMKLKFLQFIFGGWLLWFFPILIVLRFRTHLITINIQRTFIILTSGPLCMQCPNTFLATINNYSRFGFTIDYTIIVFFIRLITVHCL